MSNGFDPDAFLAEDPFDPDAFLAETAPPTDKRLPRSTAGNILSALASMPMLSVPGTLEARALGLLGATAQPVQRAGAPEVGAAEAALNKAVNAVPLGAPLTDVGSTVTMLGSRASGSILPDRFVRGLSGLPGVGQLAPVAGPGATLTPQAKKELEAMGVDTRAPQTPGVLETYRTLRDVRRARTEAGEEQNPLASLGGTAGGTLLSMAGPFRAFTPAGKGILPRIAAGAKTGALYGGLAGLTTGEADLTKGELGKAATETGVGALGGGLLGALLSGGVGAGQRLLSGVVRPTPAARALQQEGVKGLTLGQQAMTPSSNLGTFEGAAQSNAIFGPIIKGQRGEAVDSMRRVAFRQAVAPGAKPPTDEMAPPEAIKHLRQGFDAAYDEIRTAPVPTRAVDRLLTAVDDPEIIADPAARLAVSKFLQNQMGRLPPAGTETTAGVLMKIREKVRDEAFKALQSNNTDRLALLRRAETELTEGLNAGLPEAAAAKLRAADSAYHSFKILQDAVASAGDTAAGPGMFTPKGLSSAIARATGDTSYAELGGGPLRRLSSAAAQAFAEPEHTGWGASLAGGLLGYGTTPLMTLANQPGAQRFLLGERPIQQSTRAGLMALEPYLSQLNPPQAFLPQVAGEARRRRREQP